MNLSDSEFVYRGRLYKKVIKVNYDQGKRQPIRITYFVLNHYLTTKQRLKSD